MTFLQFEAGSPCPSCGGVHQADLSPDDIATCPRTGALTRWLPAPPRADSRAVSCYAADPSPLGWVRRCGIGLAADQRLLILRVLSGRFQ